MNLQFLEVEMRNVDSEMTLLTHKEREREKRENTSSIKIYAPLTTTFLSPQEEIKSCLEYLRSEMPLRSPSESVIIGVRVHTRTLQ